MPELKDIEEAFKIVEENHVVVEIRWFVPYSGRFARTIRPNTIAETTPEKYFNSIRPYMCSI